MTSKRFPNMSPAQQRLSAGIVSLGLVLALALGRGHADALTHRNCGPRHAVGVAYGTLGKAYRVPHRRSLYACVYGRRGSRKLADSFFPRPAVDIAGTLVGFAFFSPEPDLERVVLEVADLTKPESAGRFVLDLGEDKVGSLRLKSDGAVAWIQCPVLDNHSVTGSPRPNCLGAGRSVNTVYKLDAGSDRSEGDVMALDHGKQVDPGSLQLHGSTLTWVKKGERRSATLR
jgi:hypothetical protein